MKLNTTFKGKDIAAITPSQESKFYRAFTIDLAIPAPKIFDETGLCLGDKSPTELLLPSAAFEKIAPKTKIKKMKALLSDLWAELCPGVEMHQDCGPWELPFPAPRDPKACILGTTSIGESILRRAQRRFDGGRTIFMRCRKYELQSSGGKTGRMKVVLILRPGLKALCTDEKIALLRAWKILEAWCLLLITENKNLSLLDFMESYRLDELNQAKHSSKGLKAALCLHEARVEKEEIEQRQEGLLSEMKDLREKAVANEERMKRLQGLQPGHPENTAQDDINSVEVLADGRGGTSNSSGGNRVTRGMKRRRTDDTVKLEDD